MGAENLIGTCWGVDGYVLKIHNVVHERAQGVFLKVKQDQEYYRVGDAYGISLCGGYKTPPGWTRAPEYEDPEYEQKEKIAKFARFLTQVEKRHLKNVPKK